MRLLVHLHGEAPEMARAEFLATFEAAGTPFTILREDPQFLDGHAEVFLDDATKAVSRLGLAHVVAMHLFDGTPGAWTDGARECCFPTGIPFAVRYVRVDPEAPWSSTGIEREVGTLLSPGRPVDLKRPRVLARAFLLRDRIYVGQQLWEAAPEDFHARHVDRRPFSSPVSLDPRLARSLVNLARVRPGDAVVDPFCGTGGLLLEAAAVGARALGGDLDPEMVAGTRENLVHFGTNADLWTGDIADAPDQVRSLGVTNADAVVSDLPYGRSAGMGKEPRDRLYARAFASVAAMLKPGGYAVLGLPDAASAEAAGRVLEPVATFPVRAHKSLTRHFAVLRKGPTGP